MDFVPGTEYWIFQEKGIFSYSVDSVFLTAFASPKGRVADLGCGTGIFLFSSASCSRVTECVGVDCNPHAVDLAKRSVEYNGLGEKISVEEGDIVDFSERHKASFQTVFCNPPYYVNSLKKDSEELALAKHESARTLEDFVSAASRLLTFGGKAYFVLPSHRLVDIMIFSRRHRLEPKRIRFLTKKPSKPPFIFALEGAKGGKPFLKTEPQWSLYDDRGERWDYDRIYGVKEAKS